MYDEETTNRYLTYLSEKLDEALKLNIPYVVAHASKSDTPPNLTQDQIDKFTQMMSKFAGTDVYLCLENVRVNENLTTLLSLNLPNVGFCYDLGHAHSYGDTEKIFKQFEKYIKCSHIHNNFGKDTHEIPTRGEIDCKLYVEKLRQIEGTSNCLECFPPRGSNLSREDFVWFVEELYREASQL
ncbi:MAG: hypothetical protein E7354_04390 [Clostridiales bacterium]|nr:hypothetical protein [Clostridiales bacterium]